MNFNYFSMVNGAVVPHRELPAEETNVEYRDYLRRCADEPDVEAMTYDEWRATVDAYDALNTEFEALERKHGVGNVWDASAKTINQLCDRMAELEFWLLV